jgi:ribosome hibernation promoting factor
VQVIISARGLTVSRADKDALTHKLGKLEPLLPQIVETKAVLTKEKHRRTVALTLIAKRHTFRSEETAGDLGTAVDTAVDALARQVRELKARVKNRKGRRERRVPEGPPPPVAAPPVVRVRRVPLKPMPLAEAVAELRAERDDFLVFTNAATDTVNVLYRRKDGGLGLIEPLA